MLRFHNAVFVHERLQQLFSRCRGGNQRFCSCRGPKGSTKPACVTEGQEAAAQAGRCGVPLTTTIASVGSLEMARVTVTCQPIG